jgi:PAS domain S-box-containing protein
MPAQTMRWLESLLEAVPDALVGMDQKGVIQFVNRRTESLFGFDRGQVIGQPIETLVPGVSLADLRRALAGLLRGPEGAVQWAHSGAGWTETGWDRVSGGY